MTAGNDRTIALTIAYHGTEYVGWQVQPNGVSVQALVQDAVAATIGRRVTVFGSGRTDAGVHAAGQVASFDPHRWPHEPSAVMRSMNTKLPDDVVVVDADERAAGFHAQRHAVGKMYRYQFQCDGVPDPMEVDRRWHLRGRVDDDAMVAACRHFVGKHDFRGFEASGGNRATTVRTVTRCELIRQTDPNGRRRWWAMEIEANGFLYNMVRNIAGLVVEAGRGRVAVDDVPGLIRRGKRQGLGMTAPACGLSLIRVDYPDRWQPRRLPR